jgi:uncharacterized protein YfaS (alpha-2-macroglobulin family)
VRFFRTLIIVLVAAFGASSCTSRTPPPETASQATPLPPVSPAPGRGRPDWIDSISPTDQAADGAQIRVRFKNDLVPIEALESPDRSDVLAHFTIEPALAGRFIILTPKMVGFQADAPIPHASLVKVTLTAGLADRAGHRLAADFAWSFTTQPLEITSVPNSDNGTFEPQPLDPTITIGTSDAVDAPSLVSRARLVDASDNTKTIALALAPSPSPDPSAQPTDTPDASDASGPVTSGAPASYPLVPVTPLAVGTTYNIVIDPGVASLYGNLPTVKTYSGALQTYSALRFTGASLDGSSGARFAGGAPTISFSNGIEPDSAKKNISLSPAPNPNLPLLRVDSSTVSIDADALAPATNYTVKIGAGLTDVFGQQLGKDVTASFDTGDLAGDIWAPAGLSIFPELHNLSLDVSTTNLPERAYRSAFAIVHPTDLLTKDPSFETGSRALLPAEATWPAKPVAQTTNREFTTHLPVTSQIGGPSGMFVYGITARTVLTTDSNGKKSWTQPDFIGAVALTNVGIFAQWFPGAAIVRASHLSDGSPIARAKVEVYESYTEDDPVTTSPNLTPCATGTTGSDGTWNADSAGFAACASTAAESAQAPPLLVVVHDGTDWSYARTTKYGDGYGYGLYGQGWSAGAPTALGTIVSDRTLYQPGEDAKFLGISYFESNGTIGRGKSTSFSVKISSPSGVATQLGSFTPDTFGAFTIPLAVSKSAEVGYWTIEATGTGGEVLDGSYRVAEFKPPNFKVDLTLDSDVVAAGATVSARSNSQYLFGAPVEGGTSHVVVTRAQSSFNPRGWDAYTFGRQWLYPEEPPSLTSDVLQKDLTIDAGGLAQTNVSVANDLPFAMQYTVSAQTTDVSHLAVADTKTFTAVPATALIGLQSNFLATAGTPFSTKVIVTDPSGKPVTGRRVKLVLQQRIYSTATQIEEGSESARQSVRYEDAGSAEVDPGQAAQGVTLMAAKPGEYRIRANFDDATDDTTATDTQLWVAGAGEAAWFSTFDRGLTIKLDKATYRPGDTATALIESPYADADLFFSVIRHGVLFSTHRRVHGSAPQISFTVTPDMLPNAATQALLVRRGPPLANGIPSTLKNLSRVGFATFEVALDAKYLKVDVKPSAASLEPAATEHLTIHLAGRDGAAVRGEVALAVVNDSILQLSGYRFPDLVKMVYADQPISTRFADNRDDVKLEPDRRSVEKGFGFGGGAMAGAASTRVRTKFVPLAYWNGAIHTDAAGNATVTFGLPDDLTTWRVMALGLSADARFGNGETTFITTKPLVTNPVLPQFARPGDSFFAGVSVTNVARGTGTVDVTGGVTGGASFSGNDPKAVATSGPSGTATQAYRFAAVAGTGDATFTFSTKLGGASDAFSFGVPVLTDDVLESVVTTGTTKTTASVPLDVASSLRGSLGGLDVTTASTLLGDIAEPQDALRFEYVPFGSVLASRIAVASDAMILDRTYGRASDVPALRARVDADLATLRTLTLPDGGFAEWPGAQKSDVYTTAFDVTQLWQAKLAGFGVGADIAHATGFLRKVLANPNDLADCSDDAECAAEARLEVLETLGTIGEARDDFLDDVVARSPQFSYYERVELARFLLRLDAWHERGIALRDKLFEQVNLTARHATVDVRGAFGESDVAGQSQMLGLAIASGPPEEDVDRLLQTLLDQRHNGRWGCVCDDAEAMTALTLYAAQIETPPNFTAVATLPASPPKVVTTAFSGYAKTISVATLPLDEVTRGPNFVRLAVQGSGTLHYVVALRYQVPDSAPGVYQGIRVDRIVRAAGSKDTLVSFGLALPATATSVAAGQVFDVEDRVVTDHPIDNVLVTDPIPAGFEGVDQSFRTASPADLEGADTWNVDFQSIYKNRIVSFTSHLEAGSYAIHYLVRSVTPGTYAWPGATAQLQFAPEEFGRTAASQLVVTEP